MSGDETSTQVGNPCFHNRPMKRCMDCVDEDDEDRRRRKEEQRKPFDGGRQQLHFACSCFST